MSTGPEDSARAVLGVIPARYGASRFPGKPLATLWGRPLLRHVLERARRVPGLDELVIATDDDRIAEAARDWDAEVVMTSAECASGTDRVAEVARARPHAAIVLNLQGDEPELESAAVGELVRVMRADASLPMGTLAHHEPDAAALASPDVVKVVVDEDGFALYFSRADIAAASRGGPALRHAGVYAFRRGVLLAFSAWPPSPLERAERLEQLRALERGVRIKVVVGVRPFAGVDTPAQLAALEARGPAA
ncbi:MAG TPA: 3-deoxy-manno-octulosonate cytidylyltransferase [Candidatus Eisenbacteria bacterium]|nr:3-deoxy-manno-octulosonate cytidylyltransferase [Candidatus Eisenbacteria bacterium]